MNHMSTAGNLTEAARIIKHAANGDKPARDQLVFTVADNSGSKRAEFVAVSIWGKEGFADNVQPYLGKGQAVFASGPKRNLEPKEGSNGVIYNGYVLAVKSLYDLKLLGGRAVSGEEVAQAPSESSPAAQAASSGAVSSAPDYDSFDDDIPF